MSVVVIGRMKVDPANLEKLFTSRKDTFLKVMGEAKKAGVLRHSFIAGDGEVLILDEWPDAASFQRFFESQPEIPELMREGGVQGPPEISVYEVMDSPDRV